MVKAITGPGPDGNRQELTTLAGAAERLGVPASTIYYRVLKGELSWVDMGPYKLIDVERIRKVLTDGKYKRRTKNVSRV